VKKLIFALVLFYFQLPVTNCQTNYWQQQVNYIIDVSLNDKDHTLDGFEKIEYINHSPDTLKFIWFHLWPNAYKNDKTAFSDQLLENGNTKFYFSDKEQKGYINRLDFKINNTTATIEDHPQHIDIVKLILPVPLSPGEKTVITTPFHVKLPYNYSRGGHDSQSYQITQWYPKPAVYDSKGWHPMPYLEQGEFYSEFGNFDVSISVPKNYVVAATGELQNDDEKEWLKTRSSFDWEPIKLKEKIKGGGFKTTIQLFPESSKQSKTLEFKQNNIHDFAWFADKRFIVDHDTCGLASGKIIDVFTYYTPAEKEKWHNSIKFSKDAVRHYSNLVGEYPFPIVSVVQGPKSFGGGMEYPTITIISPVEDVKELDYTIAHEIGHNWFYGILATNERDHPWMDEGINTFYDEKYYTSKYGPKLQLERVLFETKAITKTDQPITTTSENFNLVNYELEAYYKTGEWMRYLESTLGTETFNKAMQDYFRRWQFKHPQPEDFKTAIVESSGKDVDSVFSYLDKKGILPNQKRTGTKTIFVLQPHGFKSYLLSPSKDLLLFGPAIGANSYDKFMIGGFITNLKLPPSGLQFFLAPMYATGSKKFAGIGFISHSFFPDGIFRKIDIGINASTFSYDEFPKSNGEKINFSFTKVSPGLKLIFRQKNPGSTRNKFIQWKTYFINEQTYGRISYDTIINLPDTTINQIVPVISESRVLNQFKLVIEDYRALYPYRGELKIEQEKNFVRAAFTGKYFFNYVKEGGLNVRLFAGKFFYTGSKTFTKQFATGRYHLNMTGANGSEDYTYSDYFIGRNKFEGLASQQIMIQDGGFKVRTDLLADKVGKTDDWLIAANFNTTIPANINPLNLLPVKIPLKAFADIGTYAEAWKQNAETDRFLFDAGLYIPLFKETINIYVPLIYSDVYKNYIQSNIPKKNRLLKTISFSIDISNLNLKKFDRNLGF
jgi:Peptidase family M1 domain